jgi:small conductance mechanosensitive channel
MQRNLDREVANFQEFGKLMVEYGHDILLALMILLLGLISAKLLGRLLKATLQRLSFKETVISMASNIFFIVTLLVFGTAALHRMGVNNILLFQLMGGVILATVFLIVLFRPYIPHLPYKVGNMIKAGEFLGRLEAIDLFHTRLKTFDGKTVFIPNHNILGEPITNYHFTATRQIRLSVGISYSSDLLKAKKILVEILAREPRVNEKPPARVFVLELADNAVEIAAWSWVKNVDYWRTHCDLIEIIKLRFDREGIVIAFPQRDVHLYQEVQTPGGEMLNDPDPSASQLSNPHPGPYKA